MNWHQFTHSFYTLLLLHPYIIIFAVFVLSSLRFLSFRSVTHIRGLLSPRDLSNSRFIKYSEFIWIFRRDLFFICQLRSEGDRRLASCLFWGVIHERFIRYLLLFLFFWNMDDCTNRSNPLLQLSWNLFLLFISFFKLQFLLPHKSPFRFFLE